MFQHEWHTCPSQQDVTDAEPESLAEDDEKELSVVHPARPTTESLEPAEVGIGSDVEGGWRWYMREIRGFSGGILKADVSQVVLCRMYTCWEQSVLLGDKKWNAKMRFQNSQACWNTTAWESNTKWFWERQWIWMAVMELALNGGFPFRYVLAWEMSVSTF